MTPQIGVDIASVMRLRAAADRQPNLLARLFTSAEMADAGQGRQRWPRLASRFAAKEAVIKAAGGLRGGRYRDIEIRRRPGRPPQVEVRGPLRQWLDSQGLRVLVSLSHEDDYAVAMVMLNAPGGLEYVAGMDAR